MEPGREVYAVPTCHACLPPPEPLPVLVPDANIPEMPSSTMALGNVAGIAAPPQAEYTNDVRRRLGPLVIGVPLSPERVARLNAETRRCHVTILMPDGSVAT